MSGARTMLAALSVLSVSLGVAAEATEKPSAPASAKGASAPIKKSPVATAASAAKTPQKAASPKTPGKTAASTATSPKNAVPPEKPSKPTSAANKAEGGAPQGVPVNKSKTADKTHKAIDQFLKN